MSDDIWEAKDVELKSAKNNNTYLPFFDEDEKKHSKQMKGNEALQERKKPYKENELPPPIASTFWGLQR